MHDKADRILKGANNTGDYVYGKLRRQTSLPGTDTPQGEAAGNLTISYCDSDLARTVTQNSSTKTLSTGIIDPQCSVVVTSYTHTPGAGNGQVAARVTMWSALESVDEYGNKLAVSQHKSSGALNYSWLGGKERATDLSGLVLMGVRLYSSVTGQFTSVDPVKGGNSTAYAYPQDPINQLDLDGDAGWWKRNWKTIAIVVRVGVAVGVG